MMKVYISHSIRGKYGKDATIEQMQANNEKAIAFGNECKEAFKTIQFYVPGEHDEFIMKAYIAGYLNEKQILDIDCKILDTCNFMIVYSTNHYISRGMQIEIDYCQTHNIPIINVFGTNLNIMHKLAINSYLERCMR